MHLLNSKNFNINNMEAFLVIIELFGGLLLLILIGALIGHFLKLDEFSVKKQKKSRLWDLLFWKPAVLSSSILKSYNMTTLDVFQILLFIALIIGLTPILVLC